MRLGAQLVFACICVGIGTQTTFALGALGAEDGFGNTRSLLEESLRLEDRFWDEKVKLVANPSSQPVPENGGKYLVRESSWYALGLLERDGPGDRERAAEAIDAVLREQYNEPGRGWFGTFRRTPEEPEPTDKSLLWQSFDPNWREFIGTTFAIVLIQYPERLPKELAARMYVAIDHSIEGEIAERRLVPTYSNIALMYGFLWDFAAQHDQRADWNVRAAAWNESVYRIFRRHNAIFEYNSPTYYGVDLYGLALWRSYGSSAHMRAMGKAMEARLWKDIAAFYHPGLRNLSGPYDRAYGMDMEHYVSLLGMWICAVLKRVDAPLPEVNESTDHLADIWFVPHIAALGVAIPADSALALQAFRGEYMLRRRIAGRRVATAWIGQNAMWGGEATGQSKDAGPASQFHPATMQWRMPSGRIGWVQLVESPAVDAVASRQGLKIRTRGTVRLRIDIEADQAGRGIGESEWRLPGMTVRVKSDAKGFAIVPHGNQVDMVYAGIHHMRLEMHPEAASMEKGGRQTKVLGED